MADDGAEKIFKVEKQNKKSRFTEINTALDKQYVVYELLGGSPNDLLLPKNFLIVEGRSEFEFISSILKRFYPTESVGIQIIFAEGDHEKQIKSMEGINTVFAPLYINPIHRNPIYRDSLVVVCDTPHPTKAVDFQSFVESYPELTVQKRLIKIPHQALELYYPKPWKKTEDELVAMSPREKTDLAKQVGQEILKEDFLTHMEVLSSGLLKCLERAYK